MLVYILNNQGKSLMPCKPQKARKLLKQNKAKVIKKEPFTIQLLFGSSGYFDLRKLDGEVTHRSASYRKIELISRRKSLLWEKRYEIQEQKSF